jgi:F-type H+-transporting ATPase subunit b
LIHIDWTLLMVAVNILILYLILKRFFFEKVRNFMLARQNAVKDAFEQAESLNQKATETLESYNKQIAAIEAEGREIIRNARIKADAHAKEITDEAGRKAGEMISQAQREIERERIKAVGEMKQQIVGLAIYAAEKIIEKQLDQAGQDELIQRVIEQAGSSGWQN